MAPKKIYIDTRLNFGKYKSETVQAILMRDPGYFHWCRLAGVAILDESITAEVDEWVRTHPGDASRVKRSADRAATKANDGVHPVHMAALSADGVESVTTEIAPKKPPEVQEAWGTW